MGTNARIATAGTVRTAALLVAAVVEGLPVDMEPEAMPVMPVMPDMPEVVLTAVRIVTATGVPTTPP